MSFYKQTINTVSITGSTVLVRVDYNVPLREDGTVADDFRIRASLPTIKKLLKDNCKVVLISHLGRPKGKDEKLSLEPAAQRLAELLGEPVRFVDKAVGDKVKMAIKRAPKRCVIVLENLRFYHGEEANDPKFARELAESSGARYFVQDGFGVVHRRHASTDAITMQIPSVAGLLLECEVNTISKAMKKPKRPLVLVLGGAKIKDKIGIIEAFIKIADKIIVTGAIANTFLAYKGYEMGKSIRETGQDSMIGDIYKKAVAKVGEAAVDDFIVLPVDLAVGRAVDMGEPRRTVTVNDLEPSDIALDIGDRSISTASEIIKNAKTVVWNGTVGYCTLPNFAHGSARIALALATDPNVTSIIGGGDTTEFVLGWDSRHGESFSQVSTGGGASLELMAGKKLPGVESLLDARR